MQDVVAEGFKRLVVLRDKHGRHVPAFFVRQDKRFQESTETCRVEELARAGKGSARRGLSELARLWLRHSPSGWTS